MYEHVLLEYYSRVVCIASTLVVVSIRYVGVKKRSGSYFYIMHVSYVSAHHPSNETKPWQPTERNQSNVAPSPWA